MEWCVDPEMYTKIKVHYPVISKLILWVMLFLSRNHPNKVFFEYSWIQAYNSTRRTSAMWNTSAAYWAIVYHAIHTQYATERMRIYNTPVGPVTSTCVSQCWSSFGWIKVKTLSTWNTSIPAQLATAKSESTENIRFKLFFLMNI